MNKAHFINTVSVALLAMLVATWSFFGVQGSGFTEGSGWEMPDAVNFGNEIATDQLATVRLNGRDSVSLLPGSKAVLNWDEATKNLTVDLKEGSVLFATLADDFSVSVVTNFFRVDSQNSVAYVGIDSLATEASIIALNHSSLLTFTLNGIDLNSLNVPNGDKLTVPFSKVSTLLSKLRLAKLSKEFPVFPIKDTDLSEELVALYDSVQQSYANNSSVFLDELAGNSDFGPSLDGIGSALNGLAKFFRNALTFSQSATDRFNDSQSADALVFAMSNLLYGDSAVGETWLATWTSGEHSKDDLSRFYSELFFVLPGEKLYPVKEAVWALLYKSDSGADPMQSFRYKFSEIESLLLKANSVDALQAYLKYQTEFRGALTSGVFDDSSWLAPISREYILLELMLRGNAVFYSTDSVKLLSDLEDKIFVLAGSNVDLNEEKQAFVQSKLRFLENLFTFVMDKKVSIEDATSLSKELLFEAESYMATIPSNVAVKEYFESKLNDYTLSVEFMNAPEFYSYDSFADGLTDYRAKKADIDELNEYLQSIRSGASEEDATLSLEEAIVQVKSDLYSNGIQYSDVVSLGDTAYRLFTIEDARSAGYSFTAKYDRETQILYDTVVGELRFSSGLSLENAKTVIEQSMGLSSDLTDDAGEAGATGDPGDTGLEPGPSSAEKVALELVKDQFEAIGLDVNQFTFAVVDLDAGTFTFDGNLLEAEVQVSGTYNSGSGLATEIIWELSGVPNNLEDTDLATLEANLDSAYKNATVK